MCPKCEGEDINELLIKDWSNPHTVKEKLIYITRYLCNNCGNVWFI